MPSTFIGSDFPNNFVFTKKGHYLGKKVSIIIKAKQNFFLIFSPTDVRKIYFREAEEISVHKIKNKEWNKKRNKIK